MPNSHQLSGDGCGPQNLTGRIVLICLITFFAVVASVNGVLIRAALSTFGGLETASSYQAGLSFARETAMAKVQETQGWRVDGTVKPGKDGTTSVEIFARDSEGRPLIGLDATTTLAHPTDRRLDRNVVMTGDTPGHFRGVSGPTAGQWDVIIELSRNGERQFRSRNRITLR